MVQKQDGAGLWTIFKIVLLTAGAIYLVSLVTWLAHWGVVAAAVGGVGYLVWHVSKATKSHQQSLICADTPMERRMKQLEAEERILDKKIGL